MNYIFVRKMGKINAGLTVNPISMNIKNFFQRITGIPKPKEELKDEVVVKFLQILEDVREEEMSCSEMYARIDEFVEREVKLQDAQKIMPLIQEHLDMCSECNDEYEALLDVLEHTQEDDSSQ